MIQVGTQNNKIGFYVYGINYRKRFISFGRLDTMTPEKMKRLLSKARKLEIALMDVMEKPPMTINDVLRSNNTKLRFVQATKGKVTVNFPNVRPIRLHVDQSRLQADVDYIAMRVFNHLNFSMDGCTFLVAKSVLKSQLLNSLR